MLSLSYYISQRYRKAKLKNRFISFIALSSTFGIALGVAALIIALSVMNGFERELVNRLLSIVPHVEYISAGKPINNWPQKLENMQQTSDKDTAEYIAMINSINAIAPFVLLKGMVQKGTVLHGIEIRGVDIDKEQQVSNIQQYVNQGSWDDLNSSNNSVILGAGIADKLGVKIGDRFQVMLPQAGAGFNLKPPKFADLTLVGTFKMGGQLDFSWGYISLANAQQLSGLSANEITGIRLNVQDVYLAEQISRQVALKMTDTVYMISWFRSQGHLYDDIKLVRFIMHLVLFIVIAVASFNIVSTLVMAVKEKQGDIAILKTMGASDNTIVFTFMLQGLGNGLKGVLYGAIIGVVVALYIPQLFQWLETLLQTKFLEDDVYFINFIPSMLLAKDVIVAVSLALVTSIIATIYPARQAIKIEPARVLGQM